MEMKFVLFTALLNLSYSFCVFIAGVLGWFVCVFVEIKENR